MINPIPASSTVTLPSSAAFTDLQLDTEAYQRVIVAANPLTTDTIAVGMIGPGNQVMLAFDVNGAAATLTAAKPTLTLWGGPIYNFTKTGTTDTANVFWTPVGGVSNR